MRTTEIKKWLRASTYGAALIAGSVISIGAAHGAAKWQASQQPSINTTMECETPSYFAPSECKPALSSDVDVRIKQYYFLHVSDFAPLPHSPRARALALREIENTIRLKLGASQKS